MLQAVSDYWTELVQRFGNGWNRFWFEKADPYALGVLRIAVGCMALAYLLSFLPDLTRLFGPEGMFPVAEMEQFRRPGDWRFSFLNYLATDGELWAAYGASLVVVLLLIVGFQTRITAVLALIVVLSFHHRAHVLSGEMESILTMMMAYLCLGPAGASLSVDAWRARQTQHAAPLVEGEPNLNTSMSANIALRLMQVHLTVVYATMVYAKIASLNQTWWSGDAVWWTLARPESRLIDLTGVLAGHVYVVNAWSHAVLLFELAFVLFIWNRLARPLLLAIAIPMWLSLALISGLVTFCLMMLVANLAFVPSRAWRACCAK